MPEFQAIADGISELTSKQRKIAEYILADPASAAGQTLRQLSANAGASEVSVLRMCEALGFSGYSELRRALMRYTADNFNGVRAAADGIPASFSNRLRDICSADVRNVTEMIDGLDEAQLFSCAKQLLEADEVLVFAHDATNIIAQYLCYRMSFLGVKAVSVKLGDVDTMQSVLARLKKNDYAILTSFPPYHAPIRNVASYCRHRGVPILVITDSFASPAALDGASVFLCGTAARYFYNSQASTVSFINILTSCMAVAMGRRFDEILAAEQDVSDFMRGGYSAEEDGTYDG